jgi:hypothetical protein
MTFPPRTPQAWDEWWEGFKKRHPETLPEPPADAPPPPPDPRDPEASKEEEP